MISVFVADIGGLPAVALNADGLDRAAAVLAEPAVRADLQAFQANGGALWNGIDEIALRPPSPAERALWEAAFFEAIGARGVSREAALLDTWVCLLVAVAPPTVRAPITPSDPPPPGRWPSLKRTR
jgi:hypothetical protein